MLMDCPRVLALIADWTGCTLWRVLWPYNALRRLGAQAWYMDLQDDRLGVAAARSDVIILPRMAWHERDYAYARRWIDHSHARGLAVLGEYDDDLFSPASRAQTELMGAGYGETPEDVERQRRDRLLLLNLLDGATVTNARVARVLAQYADIPVAVVPNAIAWDWWAERVARVPRSDPRLTIGWAGGKRFDTDFTAMAAAWARIATRFPAVQFRVAGWQPPILQAAVPADRLTQVPWYDLDAYPAAYAGVDIGCCPLEDNPFNASKTPIKAYEWAAAGAAVVASPCVYGHVLQPERHGYLVTTADEWEAALVHLIEKPRVRRYFAARWAKRVRERYSVGATLAQWPAAWQRLLGPFRARQLGRGA